MKLHEKISPLLVNSLIITVFLIIFGWGIIGLRSILVPIAFGVFLTLFMHPLSQRLVNIGLRRGWALLISAIVVFGSVLLIMGGMGLLIKNFIETLPSYQGVASTNLIALQNIITSFTGMSSSAQNTWLQNNVAFSEIGKQFIPKILSSISSVSGTISLSFIFSVLFLIYRDRIKSATIALLPNTDQGRATKLVHAWSTVLPKYLGGLGITIALLAVLNSIGFYIIGIPQFVFWGVLTAVLNIIPYLGTTIGFGGVVIFTLLVMGPLHAVYAVIMFLIVQFIDNNITTPMITGSQIQINPLAAIIGIIIGGNVWGIVGMIIALPVLGMIKITCEHIPALKPLSILIGTEKLSQ
jgi:predicted PurR-regulated permease PerM